MWFSKVLVSIRSSLTLTCSQGDLSSHSLLPGFPLAPQLHQFPRSPAPHSELQTPWPSPQQARCSLPQLICHLSLLTCSLQIPHFCQRNCSPPRYPEAHVSAFPDSSSPTSNPLSSPGTCTSAVDPKPRSPQGQQRHTNQVDREGTQWRMGSMDPVWTGQLPLSSLFSS